MEFFSNSKPDLINKKTMRNIEKMLVIQNPVKELTVIDSFFSFYENYISPNIFVLILLIMFGMFLAYRYLAKQNKELEDFRPALNPSIPIKDQQSFVHYLPDDIPENVNGVVTTYNELNPQKLSTAVLPDIPKPWGHKEINVGFTNSYKNTDDSRIMQPFDWPDNLNSSTSSAVEYMVDKNRQNFDDLSNQIADENNKLSHQAFNNGNYSDYNPSNNISHIERPFIGF